MFKPSSFPHQQRLDLWLFKGNLPQGKVLYVVSRPTFQTRFPSFCQQIAPKIFQLFFFCQPTHHQFSMVERRREGKASKRFVLGSGGCHPGGRKSLASATFPWSLWQCIGLDRAGAELTVMGRTSPRSCSWLLQTEGNQVQPRIYKQGSLSPSCSVGNTPG